MGLHQTAEWSPVEFCRAPFYTRALQCLHKLFGCRTQRYAKFADKLNWEELLTPSMAERPFRTILVN